jgi:Flp pilus assembly protein TadD
MPMATISDERTRAYKLSFVPVQQHLDGGRVAEALGALERVAASGMECAEVHNDLAVLYHAVGRLTDADRESRRALELDPFHADIRENHNAIVAALASAGSRAPAPLIAAAPATTTAPPAIAMPVPAAMAAPPAPGGVPLAFDAAPTYREVLCAAESLLAAGDLDGAVAMLERFVDREPATAEAWNDLGVLHRDAGRLGPARAALVVATTIEPYHRQAGLNLIRVLLELGHPGDALRTLEPLLTRDPRDVEALTLAGDISLALDQGGDASAFYRSALAIDPSNVELAVRLTTAAAGPLPRFVTPPAPPAPILAAASIAPIAVADTVRALEYDPRVRLVTPDESYDTVTCRVPLDRLPNPIAALSEMARLLKPGGKLWIDLGGPLEVIKHAAPRVDAPARADAVPIDLRPLHAR